MALAVIFNEPNSGCTLTSDITGVANTLTYTGTDVFAQGDLILIDDELMLVGTVNAGSNLLNNLIRGKWSTATPHSAGATIRIVNPYPNAARRISQNAVNNRYAPVFGTAEAALLYMLNAARARALFVQSEDAKAQGMSQAGQAEAQLRQDFDIDLPEQV